MVVSDLDLTIVGNPKYKNKKRPPTMGTQMKVKVWAVFLFYPLNSKEEPANLLDGFNIVY